MVYVRNLALITVLAALTSASTYGATPEQELFVRDLELDTRDLELIARDPFLGKIFRGLKKVVGFKRENEEGLYIREAEPEAEAEAEADFDELYAREAWAYADPSLFSSVAKGVAKVGGSLLKHKHGIAKGVSRGADGVQKASDTYGSVQQAKASRQQAQQPRRRSIELEAREAEADYEDYLDLLYAREADADAETSDPELF